MDGGPQRVGSEPAQAWPARVLVWSSAVAVAALALAAIRGAPYLAASLNPWIAVFAVAGFGALFAVPFLANDRIAAAHPEREETWERAMVAWGAVALGVVVAGVALIALGGSSPANSLADAAGLVLALEAALVLVVLVIWVLAG